MGRDPVHQDSEGWWFWDETWADRFGPYFNEEKARKALVGYREWLNTGAVRPGEVDESEDNP